MANIKISGAVYPLALTQSTSPNGTEIVPADSVVSSIRNTYGFTFSSLLGPLAVNYTTKTATFSGATSGSALSVTGGNYSSGVALTLTGSYVGAGTTGLLTISDTANLNGANLRIVGNGSTTPSKTIRVVSGSLQITNDAYTAVLLQITDSGAATFNSTSGSTITVSTTPSGSYAGVFYGSTTVGGSFGLASVAGSNSSDVSLLAQNKSGAALFQVRGDGLVLAQTNAIASNLAPATAWQFDCTGGGANVNEVMIANNGTYTFPTGSGVIYAYAIVGPPASMVQAFLVFGSVSVIQTGGSSTVFTSTIGTAGKINFGYNGTNYYIQNLTGAACTIALSSFRLRTGN